MPPKENYEMSCGECIHYFACSMQCGGDMRPDNADHCECYEPIESSMAYYVGTLDGAKGKTPNHLRELAEADKDGRVVVLPCKVGDILYRIFEERTECSVYGEYYDEYSCGGCECGCDSAIRRVIRPIRPNTLSELARDIEDIGQTVFLTREEAEKALEAKRDD